MFFRRSFRDVFDVLSISAGAELEIIYRGCCLVILSSTTVWSPVGAVNDFLRIMD